MLQVFVTSSGAKSQFFMPHAAWLKPCPPKTFVRQYLATWSQQLFLEIHRAIQHPLGNFPFGGFRDGDGFVGRKNRYRISFRVEADAFARDIIDHNRIERFREELLARIFE